MASWSFLTSHARALRFITADPGTRLRDLAAALDEAFPPWMRAT